MINAAWNGAVVVKSDDILMINDDAPFPRASLTMELEQRSETHFNPHSVLDLLHRKFDVNVMFGIATEPTSPTQFHHRS